ncbi:NEDD8-activating protein UBA3 NDAI_0A05160 [Naumovozyma dairenensis CBS 421]|uniref:NEDD8-activating enzyme E1 catalytic subunit n=1 Tax=Naumovozyma dairenensis (strain ATCC 10597 / BCRC 20456 / CBS 421 / NBRC 0211 / NRRL Y-12639) TaxID=1071378 RepID=G0W4D3_NAUDC|nr:hypothetical protein NDAI_0A05160 [Naumovozyma dairenensis CBS 421]CCD22671.1 hypothetical protein NDAI_0A05160 [Naumovozyma dairenensis CBS 421]
MDLKVLILGAGGLGCEILKNLTMMQVKEIHIVDMDTIELSNLNRQFLFSDDDIGKSKSITAAKYINEEHHYKKRRGVNVIPYHQDLTTFPIEFFKQFDFVISGLDSIIPRRFINEKLIEITRETGFETCIPLIDGGTEGFKGHVKTIIPGITACWECSIDTLPTSQDTVPMCTIANNPRSLEHIIEYVISKRSENEMEEGQKGEIEESSEVVIDTILKKCYERARMFNIDTIRLNKEYLLGILKEIIPAVSSTNAMIAAACCNEMLRIYSDMIDLNEDGNFTIINGAEGCFTYTFSYDRRPDCLVCGDLFQ